MRAMKALKKIRHRKMLAQEGRCYYCGLPMWDADNGYSLLSAGRKGRRPRALQCTAEHLLPRSEGGANTAENIVAACLFCNNARHRRKQPPSPEIYRMHVQRRMAAGRWLAAYLPGTGQGCIASETATRQA
jgi:5-methylcytosine-specific restriction endonuclease McrA